jgi:hypothetical protein
MLDIAFAVVVFMGLVILLFISVMAGRSYGKKQLERHPVKQLEVVIVAEGAVFTLLALLIAFSFSGAYERFENRKLHIIDEANMIDTAYKRISMLAPAVQPPLRQSFREYVDSRLELYKDASKFHAFKKELTVSSELEDKIWEQALNAVKVTNDSVTTELFLPSLTDMFDVENAGIELTRVHPPMAIFILLIGLAILSGFLAGYSTAENKSHIPLHILSYILITAFTIFITINLEFPRVGVIRVDAFDKILVTVRDRM